jgi:hypothetical protein
LRQSAKLLKVASWQRESFPPFSGSREERPCVCGQTPPAHHVLRTGLCDLVGVLADREHEVLR